MEGRKGGREERREGRKEEGREGGKEEGEEKEKEGKEREGKEREWKEREGKEKEGEGEGGKGETHFLFSCRPQCVFGSSWLECVCVGGGGLLSCQEEADNLHTTKRTPQGYIHVYSGGDNGGGRLPVVYCGLRGSTGSWRGQCAFDRSASLALPGWRMGGGCWSHWKGKADIHTQPK